MLKVINLKHEKTREVFEEQEALRLMRSKNPAEFFSSPHPAPLDESISKNPDEFFAASPSKGVRGYPHDL